WRTCRRGGKAWASVTACSGLLGRESCSSALATPCSAHPCAPSHPDRPRLADYRPVCPHGASIASTYDSHITALSQQGLKPRLLKLFRPRLQVATSDRRQAFGHERSLNGGTRLHPVEMRVQAWEPGLVQQVRLARPAGEDHQ